MKKVLVMLACISAVAATALAAFKVEKLKEGLYYVEYERSRGWSGGMLSDTARIAKNKVAKKSHQLCLEEGYEYVYFYSPMEIIQDEELSKVWDFLAGEDVAMDSRETAGIGAYRHHSSRRIISLSNEKQEGYEKCDPKNFKKEQ